MEWLLKFLGMMTPAIMLWLYYDRKHIKKLEKENYELRQKQWREELEAVKQHYLDHIDTPDEAIRRSNEYYQLKAHGRKKD